MMTIPKIFTNFNGLASYDSTLMPPSFVIGEQSGQHAYTMCR